MAENMDTSLVLVGYVTGRAVTWRMRNTGTVGRFVVAIRRRITGTLANELIVEDRSTS